MTSPNPWPGILAGARRPASDRTASPRETPQRTESAVKAYAPSSPRNVGTTRGRDGAKHTSSASDAQHPQAARPGGPARPADSKLHRAASPGRSSSKPFHVPQHVQLGAGRAEGASPPSSLVRHLPSAEDVIRTPGRHSSASRSSTSRPTSSGTGAKGKHQREHQHVATPPSAHLTHEGQVRSSAREAHHSVAWDQRHAAPRLRAAGLPHAKHPAQGKPQKDSPRILCGNNAADPRLISNGGDLHLGKPSACFRQGVGAGLHQHIDPEHLDGFVATFTAPYKKLVEQPLYYGDGPVPEGKIRATLSQSKQRGFGVGSVLLAKKILARSTQKPAHPQ